MFNIAEIPHFNVNIAKYDTNTTAKLRYNFSIAFIKIFSRDYVKIVCLMT